MDDLENNPTVRRLMDQVQRLEARLQQAEAKQAEHESPLGRVLMIKRGGEDAGGTALSWKEQTVVNGSMIPFEDGREEGLDQNGNAAGLVTIGASGAEAVLEYLDNDRHRYVSLLPQTTVRIMGTEAGIGKYDGVIVAPSGPIDPATDLAYSEFLVGAEEVLVLNFDDIGNTAHALVAGERLHVGAFVGGVSSDGRRVVVIDSFADYTCAS